MAGIKTGIWLAVPSYSGNINVEVAHSINVEMLEAFNQNIPLLLTFHSEDAIITRARNAMVMDFLASDPNVFTDMIFLDADIGFPQGTLIRLAQHPVDIVGGCYPFRRDPIGFPLTFIKGNMTERDPVTNLLKVAGMPAGCLKISRRALETIMARFPDYWYYEEKAQQGKAWRFFEFLTLSHRFFGEDYAFCALAREAGIDIWCDIDITFKHIGVKHFEGNLAAWIAEKTNPAPDPFALIKQFNETLK